MSFFSKLFGKTEKKNISPEADLIDMGTVRVIIRTDLGNIRLNNEDLAVFFRVADEKILREKGYLLIVADGMGGHQAGEVASKLAVETITKEYFRMRGSNAAKSLEAAFQLANQKIYALAQSDRALRGMGTTCTALAIVEDRIHYAHVGDSRAYQLINENFNQITRDHTYVQELVDKGAISSAEAEDHPKRNILTNAMGTKPSIQVDTGQCNSGFEKNNKLLLCSDGLYDYFSNKELAKALLSLPLIEAADHLIAEAKHRGGHDNITLILAEKITGSNGTAARETRDLDIPVTKEHELL